MAISRYSLTVVTALIILNLATHSHCSSKNLSRLFEKWMQIHKRNYNSTQEKEYRFNLFKKEVEYVENFNSQRDGKLRHTVGINQFSDMTHQEFLDAVTYKQPLNEVKKSSANSSRVTYQPADYDDIPKSLDWRDEGYVTRVRDQGSCAGASWAFATVALVEGFHKYMDGELVELSEQQLLDCDRSAIQHGCMFGHVQYALEYIANNKGLVLEKNYMFKGVHGVCDEHTATTKQAAHIYPHNKIQVKDEEYMVAHLAQKPIAVTINIGPKFRNYAGGVFGVSKDDVCGSDMLSVAVVGMGSTEGDDPVDFWILKNSWGESWGEKGYMRIVRNRNLCGLSDNAFALIETDYD